MVSKKGRKEREKERAGCLLTATIAFSVLHEESGNVDTLAQRSFVTFPNTQILYLSLDSLMEKKKCKNLKRHIFKTCSALSTVYAARMYNVLRIIHDDFS